MQEVALYDPNRKPAGWMEIIQTAQYAVFLSDVERGTPLTSVGHPLTAGSNASCLIFDSLEEAEEYCRQKIDELPKLRCDVFDSEGRAHPPVATFVNPRYAGKMDSDAKAGRMMRWSLVVMAASLPLFWYTWKTRGEAWIASVFGVQLILLGLRLLHWGYGMKEELRYRTIQSEARKQQRAPQTERS